MATPRIGSVEPRFAVEGGRITLHGEHFPVESGRIPSVEVGGRSAQVVLASPDRLSVIVPAGISESGSVPVRVAGLPGETVLIDIAAPFATGLHQVDNPVFDADGNLYVTYSGTRGQQVPVSIFRVRPNGTRETFSSGIVNPTSMTIDAAGRLLVSSRFEGIVYRVAEDGNVEPFATELGVACGMAPAADGTLFVGDRSGTIFKVDAAGHATAFATLPSSVAAYHLALGPGGFLYVTGPTLATYDVVYRVDPGGAVAVHARGFGRPQGLAFGPAGSLYVIEALAGASGLYRIPPDSAPELVLAGPALVGVAFDAHGGVVVCSNHTAYRLARFL